MKTVEDIHEWLEAETIEDDLDGTNEEQIMLQTEKGLPASVYSGMVSHERGRNTLRAGGWLNYHLSTELGYEREKTRQFGFDSGREAFMGQDPFELAVAIFNEEAASQD